MDKQNEESWVTDWLEIKLVGPHSMAVRLHAHRWQGQVFEGRLSDAPLDKRRPISMLTTISHNEMVRWIVSWGLDMKDMESVKTALLIQDDLDPATMRAVVPSRSTLG